MNTNTLLWLLRIWAVILGSSLLPALTIIVFLQNMRERTYKVYMLQYFYARFLELLVITSIILIFPPSIPVPKQVHFSIYLGVFWLWMATRVYDTVAVWMLMFHLVRLKNGHRPADMKQ